MYNFDMLDNDEITKNDVSIETKRQNREKYGRLLNNLLDISLQDSILFTTVDGNFYIDLYSKFGESFQNKILQQKEFDFEIKEVELPKFVNAVQNAQTTEEIKAIFAENNEKLAGVTIGMLNSNFDKTKDGIISKLAAREQKLLQRWKVFLNKAYEINTDTNVWPMHIGYMFISIKTEAGRVFYSPLFLKEVKMEIRKGHLFFVGGSELIVNEKLMFILNNEGFLESQLIDNDNLSPEEFVEFLVNNWNLNVDTLSIKGSFVNKKSDEITNKTIKIHPGTILGFFDPRGGFLRKRLQHIIDYDEVDEILNVDFNKNNYKQKIDSEIFTNDFKLYKIQKTNFSQDKATISALNQNTIIWGPPGTGKSQTIANLITNILVYGKTSLVVSQKKAALEVLRVRLKELNVFCLFILTNRQMNKKEFYQPLQRYIKTIENYRKGIFQEPIDIISSKEKKYIDFISKVKSIPNFETAIEILQNLYKNSTPYSTDILKMLFKLSTFNYKYNSAIYEPKDSKAFKEFISSNNIKHEKESSLFSKFKRDHKYNNQTYSVYNMVKNDLKNYHGDVDEIINKIKKVKEKDLEKVENLFNLMFIEDHEEVNDIKILVNMVVKTIAYKVENFTPEYKKLYSDFRMSITAQKLGPQKFININYKIIKEIFPIIITTPDTELSYWEKNEFDYAILDESSQIFIEKALPILYLAKIKVLAGDDQQMQPTRWFSARFDNVEENALTGIESILDFATAKGLYSILLDKNYRSNYASLMTFNSKHFYKSNLDVLDVNDPFDKKPIEVINVGGRWENSHNREEAKIVLQLIAKYLPVYEKIIVLCFNKSQQTLLENTIFNGKLPDFEQALTEDRLSLKNIENIQGDEADLVIMSVSYDSSTKLFATYVAKNGGKNALNVAISRARDKMIVVKSIYAQDINITATSSEDLIVFKNWLQFLDLPENMQRRYVDEDNKKDSSDSNTLTESFLIRDNDVLVEEVKTKLEKKLNTINLKIEKDFSIGTKKVDLAVLDDKTNMILLAIQVDNYFYKDSYKKYIIEKDQNNFIKSKKYKIYSLKEIDWLLDQVSEVNRIISEVNKSKKVITNHLSKKNN